IPLVAANVRPAAIICFSSWAPLLSFSARPLEGTTDIPSTRTTTNAPPVVGVFSNLRLSMGSLLFESDRSSITPPASQLNENVEFSGRGRGQGDHAISTPLCFR